MDNSGIYCIYFDQKPNEYYIGRSSNLYVRLQEHKSALLSNRHINYKLQNYYAKYGMPNFEILQYANPEILNTLEEQYISEFDSYKNGLNLTNGGDGPGFGEAVHSAKHSEAEYVNVLKYLANTNYSCAKIASMTGVSRDIVKHISSGYAHGYLSTLCPEEYSKVMSKKYTRDNSAASKGIEYPLIKSPEGIEYSVLNIHKFCDEHGLQPQNLHKVLTKQRNSHKGWKLA
jgi:group I intron endonuclease